MKKCSRISTADDDSADEGNLSDDAAGSPIQHDMQQDEGDWTVEKCLEQLSPMPKYLLSPDFRRFLAKWRDPESGG
jgi:hypothetical protein